MIRTTSNKEANKKGLWLEIEAVNRHQKNLVRLDNIQTSPKNSQSSKSHSKEKHTQLFAENLHVYVVVQTKPTCIRSCEEKTHVQEERRGKMII